MLRPICSALALLTASLSAACQATPTAAERQGWISGQVVNVAGDPINAVLTIGGDSVETNSEGHFSFTVPEAEIYRIEIAADGHYSMRQTFSHAELLQSPNLGNVTLVARKPGRTMFVFGGDAMIGRRFYKPFEGEPVLVQPHTRLEDSKRLLREMKPYLERADYASINLETPIFDAPPGPAAAKSVTFYSAPETLTALEWAGVDYVALGNNHTYDFLEPGLDITLQHLEDSRLAFSGAGKVESEAVKPHTANLAGHSYDLLSFVGWPAGTPSQSAEAKKGGAALGTTQNLLDTTEASIGQSRAPIIQYHGGLEYVAEPTLAVETRLKRAVDAGAALVIGHHPHVTQGLELYNGKLIAWSLGNFLFDQYFYSAQSAALLYVWMDGDEFYHAEAVPVYVKGYHPTPALGPMRNMINRRLYELSKKRGTMLYRSGGHIALSTTQRPDDEPVFATVDDCQGDLRRTGSDLLARGDFDAYAAFEAPDRSWLDLHPDNSIQPKPDAPWDYELTANVPAGETITTGMRKFHRVFYKGNPMTVRADLSSTSGATVDAFLQIRAEGERLSAALENGRKIKLGRVSVPAEQSIKMDFDFDSPRTRTRSLRLLLEISAGDQDTTVTIDDFEYIQWDTPFMAADTACNVP